MVTSRNFVTFQLSKLAKVRCKGLYYCIKRDVNIRINCLRFNLKWTFFVFDILFFRERDAEVISCFPIDYYCPVCYHLNHSSRYSLDIVVNTLTTKETRIRHENTRICSLDSLITFVFT